MADKNNGGQVLDLLTTDLKTDSNRPMHREFCKNQKYWTTQSFLCIKRDILNNSITHPGLIKAVEGFIFLRLFFLRDLTDDKTIGASG